MKDSSLDAYQSILDKLSDKRKKVLDVIRDYPNGIFDKQISMLLGWDINRVTGRRGELEKMGLIESVGRKKSPYSKIPVHHWIVSDPEKAVAESKRVKEKPMTFTKEDVDNQSEILSVAWKTLEWVGFTKGGEFTDNDIKEMFNA
jgi:hypothetical protein